MPATAAAVILLLNGLQIALPRPAFIQDGRAWVPARAVLQAAGYQVQLAADGTTLDLQRPGQAATVHLHTGRIVVGRDTKTLEPPPRNIQGALYLPAAIFPIIGMKMQWDAEAKALRLNTAQEVPTPVTIRELKDDPFRYLGRTVKLAAECTGTPHRTGSRQVCAGRWLVRGKYDAISCELVQGQSASTLPPALPHGYRLDIVATVRMYKDASLYLDIIELHEATGIGALTITITTDRAVYRQGEPLLVEVELANLTERPLQLAASGTPHLSISNRNNEQFWSQIIWFPATMQAAETQVLAFSWRPPPDIPPGDYVLDLYTNTEQWAHQWCFTIQGAYRPGYGAQER